MDIPLCYAIETGTRYRNRTRRESTTYRGVVYRVSLDAEGRPAYLEKYRTRAYFMQYSAKWTVLLRVYGTRGAVLREEPFWYTTNPRLLRDAGHGKPVSERDALVFAPHLTHPMAALDWLRERLENHE